MDLSRHTRTHLASGTRDTCISYEVHAPVDVFRYIHAPVDVFRYIHAPVDVFRYIHAQ